MKSTVVTVNSDGLGMGEALAITETLGKDRKLDNKSVLHLRLLAEELLGMLRSIAGKVEATYWIESEEKSFELHMKSDIKLTAEMREQFISAASSGKNDAAKGFMGKIKVLISNILVSAKEMIPYAMINAVSAYPAGGNAGENISEWSMNNYKEEVRKHIGDSGDAVEAWDELEKSIVANIADDVKVRIMGKTVEITVYKVFG